MFSLGYGCGQAVRARHDQISSANEEGCYSAPTLSSDRTPDIDSIEVSLDQFIEIEEIPLGRFQAFRVDGTRFRKNEKVGIPLEDPKMRKERERSKLRAAPSKSLNLLSKLLPVLLPPARLSYGDVFDLPSPLYAFQKDGIKWLWNHQPGALLADEMGLGKTIQSAVALRHFFRTGDATRALVVAPRAEISTWRFVILVGRPDRFSQTAATAL